MAEKLKILKFPDPRLRTVAKKVTTNTHDDLEILKKLGKLRKSEVITEKEFQAKKKKILGRI